MADQGFFVVVCGPDGSGKTTLARTLMEKFGGPGLYFHFIPSPSTSLLDHVPEDDTLIEKNREAGSRFVGWLRIGRNLVRAWAAYLRAIKPATRSGRLVVGDRWLYGFVGQPLALKFHGPAALARFVLRLIPRPDLVVVLDAPASVIHSRKAELSIDEIESERERWKQLSGSRALRLDSSLSSNEMARIVLSRLQASPEFKRYPPVLGHVLIPRAPRSAALAGSTLYTPARRRGLIAQRVARGLTRLIGPIWLRDAGPGQVPIEAEHRSAFEAMLGEAGLTMDSVAFYTRTQRNRSGYSVLVIDSGKAVGFVRVGPPDAVDRECLVLEMIDRFQPTTFRYPKVVARASVGESSLVLLTVVLDGFHKPPMNPPVVEISNEIRQALADVEKPVGIPSHWVPIHGDFTPWNLRTDRTGLSLVDWESVDWGPPDADVALYEAAAAALNGHTRSRAPSAEAASFWSERLGPADNKRDARLRERLLEALRPNEFDLV